MMRTPCGRTWHNGIRHVCSRPEKHNGPCRCECGAYGRKPKQEATP